MIVVSLIIGHRHSKVAFSTPNAFLYATSTSTSCNPSSNLSYESIESNGKCHTRERWRSRCLLLGRFLRLGGLDIHDLTRHQVDIVGSVITFRDTDPAGGFDFSVLGDSVALDGGLGFEVRAQDGGDSVRRDVDNGLA